MRERDDARGERRHRVTSIGSSGRGSHRSRACSSSTSRATCRARSRAASCCGSAHVSCASSRRTATRSRDTAPAWHDALNAGKESVVCDLKSRGTGARARLARARGRRARGLPPGRRRAARRRARRCARRRRVLLDHGFGLGGRHEQRAGHDLNYLGWAGALADTTPALPPLQIADLAAGALGAVTQILAALSPEEARPDHRLDDARLARPRRAPRSAAIPSRSCSRAASPATASTRPPTDGT